MRKASELIDLARKDPRYLAEDGIPYLCHVLYALHQDGVITWGDIKRAKAQIYVAIKGATFLRTHLRLTGVINHLSDENSPEFPACAQAFWEELIEKLQVAGN